MAWQNPKTDWKAGDIPTASDFNRIEGNIEELENTKETPAGAQAKVNTHAGSKQTHGISSGYYIAKTSRSDQLPAWNDIQGKPNLALASDLAAHKAETAIHKTSDVIRTETNTKLKVEVVSSSVSKTPDVGRIIFDTSQGKFFGGNGTEWV